jgi:sugar lactone lactonase YvrE
MAGPDTFVGPTDVVVNARGEIFVADGHTPRPGAPDGDRIVKLSKDGTFIKAWGSTRGAGPGEVTGPHRLALDSQGRLFVADRGNRRIQIFDQEGRFLVGGRSSAVERHLDRQARHAMHRGARQGVA